MQKARANGPHTGFTVSTLSTASTTWATSEASDLNGDSNEGRERLWQVISILEFQGDSEVDVG